MAAPKRKTALRILIGSVLGLLLVWLLFRGSDWSAIRACLRAADPGWLILSQLLLLASHLLRVERAGAIVRATHPVPYRALFAATQLGFVFAVTLPMRLGEGVRALLLSRLAKIRLSTSMAMTALDRVSDILALVVVAWVALISFPTHRNLVLPPGAFQNAEAVTIPGSVFEPLVASAALLLVILVLTLVVLHRKTGWALDGLDRLTSFVPPRVSGRLRAMAEGFAAGTELLGSARRTAGTAALSLAVWGSIVLALAAILHGFSIDFDWYVPFAVQAMISLFVSAPLAPGLIGQFHLGVVVCLLITVPELPLAEAQAVALATHVLSMLPIALLGLTALGLTRTLATSPLGILRADGGSSLTRPADGEV